MPVQPSQPIHLGPNGICKIYYGCPNHANSSFPKPKNMKEIRNVEFRFHMEKDSTKRPTLTPFPPSVSDFHKCPIWHFVDEANRERDPTVTIVLTYDGVGRVPRDYEYMLDLLQGLMCDLRTGEFGHVVVKLGLGYHADERLALMEEFEYVMGEATVMDGSEGRHMEFCPREYKDEWEESQAEERDYFGSTCD